MLEKFIKLNGVNNQMKFIKQYKYQCNAIVKPGEYVINKWDNKQCTENNPRMLAKCEVCQKTYCLMQHWKDHNCPSRDE
jgi:hypothetical protein